MADSLETQSTARKVRGRPFAKGNPHRFKSGDPRINVKGRPKSFDAFRELAQSIAEEDGTAEAILRGWVKNPRYQRDFIEYAFGKVPEKIEATGLENKTVLVLHFDHEKGVTQQ